MDAELPEHLDELKNKILKGVDLSFKKLVREKAAKNEELIFSENGKVFRIKAKDLLK